MNKEYTWVIGENERATAWFGEDEVNVKESGAVEKINPGAGNYGGNIRGYDDY